MAYFDQIGPVQILLAGFDTDELGRRERRQQEVVAFAARNLVQVLEMQFARLDERSRFSPLDLTQSLDETELTGRAVILARIELPEAGMADENANLKPGALAAVEQYCGLSVTEVHEIADALAPGEAVALLIYAPRWTAVFHRALSTAEGYRSIQPMPTPEAMVMIGRGRDAQRKARLATQAAEEAKGAALLEALATMPGYEESRRAATMAKALVAAGLLKLGAARDTVLALQSAGLLSPEAVKQAEDAVTDPHRKIDSNKES